MRRRAADRDTAPAGVGVVPRALGRPWVAVRGHYGSLPSMAGRERANGRETCRDGSEAARNPRAEDRARPEAWPQGPKSPWNVADGASLSAIGAPEGGADRRSGSRSS